MYKTIKDFYVGQEVYVGKEIIYGWNDVYKYKVYKPHTIKSISPKRKVITLDNGVKVKAYDSGYTDIPLYEYNPEMENDSEKAYAFLNFLRTKKYFVTLYTPYKAVKKVSELPTEQISKITEMMKEIVTITFKEE